MYAVICFSLRTAGEQLAKKTQQMFAWVSNLWSLLTKNPTATREDIETDRQILHLSQEQLEVEIETEQTLSTALIKFKSDLELHRMKHASLVEGRLELLDKIANARQSKPDAYKDAEIYLLNELPKQIADIEQAIQRYEQRIASLEYKLNNLKKNRNMTHHHSEMLEQQIVDAEAQLTTQNVQSGLIMNNDLELQATAAVPVTLVSQEVQPLTSHDALASNNNKDEEQV